MDWPEIPIEKIPPEAFLPTRCPIRHCPSNAPDRPAPFAFRRHGFYDRKCDGRRVPRFHCCACGRTFSQQTFTTSYYLKRPELLVRVADELVGCSAHRQIARACKCAASTVSRLAARLARHAITFQARTLQALEAIDEPVVYDHFESFAHSQYFPLGLGTAYAQDSRLLLSLDLAPHRRCGRMSDYQKKRRDRLEALYGKPKPQAYARALRETLDRLLAKVPQGQRLRLVSDDHKQYALAVSRHPRHERIDHLRLANPRRGPKGSPRSAAARRRDAALATVDFAHQFLRHSLSHQRRETIAFARRHSSLAEQIFTHGVWLNYVKLRAERQPRAGTRAMHAGLSDRPWDWTRILARRLQPFEVDLPPTWEAVLSPPPAPSRPTWKSSPTT
ncbi:MAG: hypothetical protein Q9Q13_04510 [Acidobacteriota bacterium]|nr:hypothetical protein [Acidobacteriota bacterium]